jgi:hypothetical protein
MEAHVGSQYGVSPRILIVSLDAGDSSEKLEARSRMIDPITSESKVNPHMHGTAKFIETLLNINGPEKLPMAYVAMLNSAKCAGADGRMDTVPFAEHYQCRHYAFGEIGILKPDLVWLQGSRVRDIFDDHMSKLNTSRRYFSQYFSGDGHSDALANSIEPIALEYFRVFNDADSSTLTIVTPHPSDRYGRWALFERAMMPLVANMAISLAKVNLSGAA